MTSLTFKSLNERYGRQNCDQLLQDLAVRLVDLLPDYVVGGRIGADTFAFLIVHQPDHRWVSVLANISKGLLGTSLSVKFGVVENVDHHLAVSLTCDHAIMALERIKKAFGVDVVWYNDKLRERQHIENMILESMETALEEHQFTVYYQPKHDLRNDRTGGAEALVRWIHPTLGFISPGDFIPIFERSGFITKLDLYVCEEACKQLKRCEELGLPMVPISFNASQLDFDDEEFAHKIAALTDTYGIERSLLHVEVTETACAENPEHVIDLLTDLREHGFHVELDDFGSGYSSLASLNMLPLDVMKLDMSIIRQASELDDFRIVQSAIQMAQFLNLGTVAEGVETQDEMLKLKELGRGKIQGYYYSRPIMREDFEAYLAKEA
ncbi:MAG: GGDEF domain-containing phosphodiesterase [Coriobacteriales bacterium]|nr:GGDEF domain-containing phosphodiesterase [Coriobacteriales bacterium]